MPRLIPVRDAVVDVFGDAPAGDDQAIRKAVKRLYNKKGSGSLPSELFVHVGGALYIDVIEIEKWISDQKRPAETRQVGPGRPRNVCA